MPTLCGPRRPSPLPSSTTRRLPSRSATARRSPSGETPSPAPGARGRATAAAAGGPSPRRAPRPCRPRPPRRRPAVGAELDRPDRPAVDAREVAQAAQRARVVQAHAAVRQPRGDDSPGRADRERGRVVRDSPACRNGWTWNDRAEAAVPGDIPDDDPAVQPARVERAPVIAGTMAGDRAGLAGQGLAHGARAHVPDQHLAVVGPSSRACGRRG